MKRSLIHLASERPEDIVRQTNEYLQAIENSKSPIQDVQIVASDYHGAFWHIFLLIISND